MGKLLTTIFMVVVLFCMGLCMAWRVTQDEIQEPISETQEVSQVDWETVFTNNGFSEEELVEKLNNLAKKHDTSFNNIVINIIESFFKENETGIE